MSPVNLLYIGLWGVWVQRMTTILRYFFLVETDLTGVPISYGANSPSHVPKLFRECSDRLLNTLQIT